MLSTLIDPSAIVHPKAELQADTLVEAGCRIGPHVRVGGNVKILAHTRIQGEVKIGFSVVIGPHATLKGPLEIQDFARIEAGAKIGVKPASGSTLSEGTIHKYARIGEGAEVLGKLWVGEYAQLLAGARLEGDLPNHAIAGGNPAALKEFACECGREFARYRGIAPELFIGDCPVCTGPGYRISLPEVRKRGHILRPNHQVGEKVTEAFFDR